MPFTDSASATAELPLRGVWLHSPADPESTARFFPYGANQRGDSYDAMGTGTYYVGKEDPVFDFGDPSGFSVDVTVDVLHGPDYFSALEDLRRFAASKMNLWFRDNRSRAVHGTIAGLKTSDQGWGTQASFTFTKATRAIVMAVS